MDTIVKPLFPNPLADQDANLLLLRKILDAGLITTVFQPIVSLRDASVLGYEALSRGPADTALHMPIVLFTITQQNHLLWELDWLCRNKALQSYQKHQKRGKLFLNVDPSTMNNQQFKDVFTQNYLQRYSTNPDSIVFEITESNAIENINNFIQIVDHYKSQNYKLAIDDAGAGYSGLNLISDIHPHYLKLDQKLINRIDKDTMKQALVKSMVEFSNLTHTFLIGEGIETRRELETLIKIGVHYGQGFFIQKPSRTLPRLKDEVAQIIKAANIKKNHLYGYRLSNIQIGDICENQMSLQANILISQAEDLLRKNAACPGFCITEDGKAVGVITKQRLREKLSGLYEYSLYSDKPLSIIMNREFLNVDESTPIDVVSKLAMSRDQNSLYDFITISREGRYFGLVTIKSLLEKAMEIEVANARHLNPLTELPGNIIIEQCLERCIASERPFSVLYLDIDRFKAYNDVYGFENGDIIIKQLSVVIGRNIAQNDFLGHRGGDDFIAILDETDPAEACRSIIHDFDRTLSAYYSRTDWTRGYSLIKTQTGGERQIPLLSLSIAGIINESRLFGSIFSLSEQADKVQKQCKQINGSSFLLWGKGSI
ncbi:MAG: GGDEF domain-containing protein [Clostridiaceae bacterium]|nr:GGDEF domain-containing protein [Clostridiaceae bacterium]